MTPTPLTSLIARASELEGTPETDAAVLDGTGYQGKCTVFADDARTLELQRNVLAKAVAEMKETLRQISEDCEHEESGDTDVYRAASCLASVEAMLEDGPQT